MEPTSQEISQWLSDVAKLEEEIAKHKRSRNYYEGKRKKTSAQLDALLKADPRQMKLEIAI